MDKLQALHSFWASFGWKAYDETSVPDTAQLPYITYESSSDNFDHAVAQTASLWDRSTSWANITAKQKEIETAITRGGKMIPYDGGAVWIKRGQPFAQRMADDSSDTVRRIVLNIETEFLD